MKLKEADDASPMTSAWAMKASKNRISKNRVQLCSIKEVCYLKHKDNKLK